MPTFVAKVRKDTGETVEQLISVPKEEMLGSYLANVDGCIIDCQPYESIELATLEPQRSTKQQVKVHSMVRSRPTEIVTFSWYLYTLVNAGVPLARALHIVRSQLQSPTWDQVVSFIIANLEKGESFADSMRRFPRFFPEHFVHLVDVGEIAGNLDSVLQQLAIYYEKQLETRSRVRGAMAYPTVLIGACFIVVFFLVAFVLPRIAKMFVNMNLDLPWITNFLLNVSQILRANILLVPVGLAAIIGAFVAAKRTPAGQRILATASLRMPLLGTLYRKVLMARFCQTLALLQRSGVSLLVSLGLARQTVTNVVLREFLDRVEKNITEGAPLGTELARSPYIPEMVSSMISVGEESGQMTEMLTNVSRFYEREIDQLVRTLPKIVEPAIIVVMTGVVGMLAASVFIPLSQLTKGIG